MRPPMRSANASREGVGVPYVLNYNWAQLAGWRAARDAGNAKVAFVGDSTFAGVGANPTGSDSFTNSRAYSMPAQLAALLSAGGLAAESDSFWADGGNTSIADMEAYNPSIDIGGNWVRNAGTITLGGPSLKNGEATADTTSMTFTPIAEVDSFDIYYIQANFSLGTFTVNIDGGSTLATVNSNGTPETISKVTVGAANGDSVSVGPHDVRVQRNGTGGNIYITAIDAYVAGDTPVRIWNMGRRSSTTALWIAGTAGWSSRNALVAVDPDLTVFSLGINDWLTGVSTATFTSNAQTFIDAIPNDGVLCIPSPSASGSASLAVQAEYRAAIIQLGVDNNMPVLDLAGPLGGSYLAGDALELYYDAIHPNGDGYAVQASAMRALLLA